MGRFSRRYPGFTDSLLLEILGLCFFYEPFRVRYHTSLTPLLQTSNSALPNLFKRLCLDDLSKSLERSGLPDQAMYLNNFGMRFKADSRGQDQWRLSIERL